MGVTSKGGPCRQGFRYGGQTRGLARGRGGPGPAPPPAAPSRPSFPVPVAGLAAGLGWGFYLLWPLGVLHLVQQILRLDTEDPQLCLSLFHSNRDFGLIVLVAIIAGTLTG